MSQGNLYELLVGYGANKGCSVGIETPEGHIVSYGDLDAHSARLANLLTFCGVLPGDRVAVQVEKSSQAICLYLACLRAGAVYLPINTAYTDEETRYFLDDAQPKVVVCTPNRSEDISRLCIRHGIAHVLTLGPAGEGSLMANSLPLAADFPTVAVSSTDVAAILYSSGTTGKPKGVMLTHGNLASNAAALVQAWGFTSADVLLHALPIFHVHGLFVALHCALMSGARMLFLPQFDAAKVCSLLPRATVFMRVPTYYTRLLAHPRLTGEVTAGMRLFTSGSAPLLPDTFAQFRQRTGHAILERYGLTETGMNTSNPLDGPRLPGTVGLPLPGVEVRVAGPEDQPLAAGAVGEIQVRGPNVFAGYWRRPELSAVCFTPDGFFRTGDLGRIDADGYVSIVGRSKDLIITGGYNVYPKEVEDCIDRLVGVQESAVIGMPHPDFGEAVMAVVVPRAGATVKTGAIKTRLRGRLANYKLPKLSVLTKELPRNAMGKVQKNRLREEFLPHWQEFVRKTQK